LSIPATGLNLPTFYRDTAEISIRASIGYIYRNYMRYLLKSQA